MKAGLLHLCNVALETILPAKRNSARANFPRLPCDLYMSVHPLELEGWPKKDNVFSGEGSGTSSLWNTPSAWCLAFYPSLDV